MRRNSLDEIFHIRPLLDNEGTSWLSVIKDHTEATSDSEGIRKSVIFYEMMLNEMREKNQILACGEDEINILYFIGKKRNIDKNSALKKDISINERGLIRIDKIKKLFDLSRDQVIKDSLYLVFSVIGLQNREYKFFRQTPTAKQEQPFLAILPKKIVIDEAWPAA